jgi:phosphate transport system protein
MTPAERGAGFRHFHDQLALLEARLLEMSTQAEGLVDLAIDALLAHDAAKAEAVIAGDHDLDALENEVERLAVSLLALQQPLARDLRFIIGALKVSSDLERVGDHAVNIAQCALRLRGAAGAIHTVPHIEEMARRSRAMLGDAIDAFLRADGVLGRAVFRVLVDGMGADPRAVPASVELLLVRRNLERVADLATNIGEDAVYVAEGTQIKHHADARSQRPVQIAGGGL